MNPAQQQPTPPPQQAPPQQPGPVKLRERKQVGGNNIWCVFISIHLSVIYQLFPYRSEYVIPTRVDVTLQKRSCLVGDRPPHPLLHRFVDSFMFMVTWAWQKGHAAFNVLLFLDCWSRGGRSCPDQWWKWSACCWCDQSWWVGFLQNTQTGFWIWRFHCPGKCENKWLLAPKVLKELSHKQCQPEVMLARNAFHLEQYF